MATEQFIIHIATRGSRKSADDIKRIGQSASAVRKTLAFMRAALVAVAAVRVFGRLASDLAAFSDSMAAVRAITGATTMEFKRLRDVAKGLGATTRFTAAEAADGMAFLARAGFEVNEIIGTIPGTLDLASAGMLDLGNAADIASNLMTSFGLSTAETTGVIDDLVDTANRSNTTVQQLADGLKLVAPIASGLGVELKDAASAMAILGDNGIQASLAGTGFRRVLTDLEAPTGTLLKVLKALNIPLNEVRPSAVGLTAALERLKEANIGASVSSVLFGKRGGFVAAALLRDVEKIKKFRLEMEKNGGTAKRVAKIMEDNLAGSFRAVRSAIQAVIIAFGDLGAEEFLKDFFFGLAEALRAVARNADDVVAAIKVLIAVFVVRKILLYGQALLFVGASMLKMVGAALLAPVAFFRASVSVRTFGAALNAIPFVRIITLLGVALAGLTAFRDEIKLTKNGTATLGDVFSTLSDILDTEFTQAINSVGFEFKDFREIMAAALMETARLIRDTIAVAFGLVPAFKAIFLRIKIEYKKFLLDLENNVFETQSNINKLAGFEVFDVSENSKEVLSLIVDIQDLNKEIEKGGTVFEAFKSGFDTFMAAQHATTTARLIAERDAAILATEEANRRAAKARIIPDKPVLDGDITLEEIGLPDAAAEKALAEIERLTQALRDLESEFFPLMAAQNAEAEILKTISDARAKGILLRVSEVELLKRAARAQLGLGITVEQAAEQQQVYKNALDDSIISLAEFKELTRDLNIELLENTPGALAGVQLGLLRVGKAADDVGSQISDAIVGAFDQATDAFLEFVKTGKFSFSNLVDFLIIELTRLAFQKSVVASLTNLIGGLLGGVAGATAGTAGTTSGIGNPSAVPSFPEFADGGRFTVGSSTSTAFAGSGRDDRLVQFRARRGEDVEVTPPGERKEEKGGTSLAVTQNFIINNPIDPDGFKRSQGQIAARGLTSAQRFQRRVG